MQIRKLQYNDLNDLCKLFKGFWNEDSNLLKMQKTFKKIDQVILVTDTERKDSQAFYESQGYPKNKNVGYKKKISI